MLLPPKTPVAMSVVARTLQHSTISSLHTPLTGVPGHGMRTCTRQAVRVCGCQSLAKQDNIAAPAIESPQYDAALSRRPLCPIFTNCTNERNALLAGGTPGQTKTLAFGQRTGIDPDRITRGAACCVGSTERNPTGSRIRRQRHGSKGCAAEGPESVQTWQRQPTCRGPHNEARAGADVCTCAARITSGAARG